MHNAVAHHQLTSVLSAPEYLQLPRSKPQFSMMPYDTE